MWDSSVERNQIRRVSSSLKWPNIPSKLTLLSNFHCFQQFWRFAAKAIFNIFQNPKHDFCSSESPLSNETQSVVFRLTESGQKRAESRCFSTRRTMSVRSSLSWSQTTWKGPKEVARLVDFLTTATRILMTVMMMMSLWCRVYLTENCLAAPSRVPALVAALQSPRNLRPLCVDQFFFLAIVCATSKWSAFSLDDQVDYVFCFPFRLLANANCRRKQWTALLTLSAVIFVSRQNMKITAKQ